VRIVIDPGALEGAQGDCDEFFATRLGPAIRDDSKRYCPKDTGALADSVEDHLEGHDLIISATGNDERDYAAYVDGGHRIVAWGVKTGRVKGPNPFMRSALYQERPGL
jgi:hypothetical protein